MAVEDTAVTGGELSYDPFLPGVLADPYPTFARLREEDPAHWSPKIRSWVLTRYQDIREVFFHDRRLSIERTKAAKFKGQPRSMRTLTADPPDGPAIRALLTRALSPRTAIELAPRIDEMVDELLDAVEAAVERQLDELPSTGVIDLIEAFAYPLPIRVICEMFGVPYDHRDRFQAWSSDLAVAMDRNYSRTTASQSTYDLNAYMRQLVQDRRKHPGDDFISRLWAAEVDGDRLTEDELVAVATVVIFAGHETTVNLIGNGMLALLRNPDQLERVRSDGELSATAVEELLRYDSPAQLISRTAADDLELHGKVIRPGESVVAMLGAANRDPAMFDEPDRLDVARHPNPHLAFGHGAHFCLGANLSRREAQLALPAFLQRFPALRLVEGRPPRFRSTLVLRGLEDFAVAVS